MSKQPTLELILSSPQQVFTVTNFHTWMTTAKVTNSPISTVYHFQSAHFSDQEYIVLECKISAFSSWSVTTLSSLWILMDIHWSASIVSQSDYILISPNLQLLVGLGWNPIKAWYYGFGDIQTKIPRLRQIGEMYNCVMRHKPLHWQIKYIGSSWLCNALLQCLSSCRRCFQVSGDDYFPADIRFSWQVDNTGTASCAYAAYQYFGEKHAKCLVLDIATQNQHAPVQVPSSRIGPHSKQQDISSTVMNGLSQPKFTTGDSNTLLLEFPACSPYIPSVHNPGPKKRLHNASGLGGTNCGSRKLPLRSTSPEPTRKRPRVDLDENSEIYPIPHEVSYTSVTPPKSHVTVIHSTMSASEVVAALGYYGCEDLGPRLDVRSCGEHPVCNGGLGDIYIGRLDGLKIAIKTTRMYIMNKDKKYLKYAAKELYTWSKCKHPNVLRLLGLVEFRGQIGMISAWMAHGDVRKYLNARPETDRCQLCHSIADGLAYLHDVGIIHGDLKGANILISEDGVPMLNDFGNAVLQEHSLEFTESTTRTNISPRWTAPEILEGSTSYSYAADVYALGMEVITGKVPFSERRNDVALAHLIVNRKETPHRPSEHIPSDSKDGDAFWSLIISCWAYKPEERPSAKEARDIVKRITQSGLSYVLHDTLL